MDAPLTIAALYEASQELAYLNDPVEARLAAPTLNVLRLMFPPAEQPTPLSALTGLRLIVEPGLAPGRIEFRDKKGRLVSSFDIPVDVR